MPHTGDCACGQEFRFEAADLVTGRVVDVLHPINADWQTELNAPGHGSLTLATRDVPIRSIWPHLRTVYILRIAGGSATPENPVVEGAGIVEEMQAGSGGTTQLGLVGIEHYLNHRRMDDGYTAAQRSQTEIGKDYVELAQPDGIQLFGHAVQSDILRDITHEPWEYKNIGEALKQLTELINGPDWVTVHRKEEGRWLSTIVIQDNIGSDRNITLRSDREATDYGLEVDASNQANHVVAIGEGEEEDMLTAESEDLGIYPRFDAAPAWKSVSRQSTLQQHADGYVEQFREPYAAPSFTIHGLDPDPDRIRLGDTINLDTNFGAVTYKGKARVIIRAWRLGDASVTRTFETVPLTRASQAVLSQTPTDDCKDC